MKSILCLLVLYAPVIGQVASTAPATQPETAKPEVKPEDKCAIEGTVVNALTGEPLKKAQLHLRPIGQQDGISYGTSTDAAGHFLLDEVDPGRYSLNADRNGFVTQAYSPQGNTKRSTTLTLANGQKLKELVFKLTPQGVVAGRVLDQDGDPMARVQLQAMNWMYMRGKKQLIPGSGASTNDLGEFRIFGLRPGKYVLSATYQNQNSYMQAAERAVGQTAAAEEGYLTTYYPGATTPESATQMEVTAGAQLQGITMTLVRARTVRIKGRIVSGPPNESHRNVMLMLIPRDSKSYAFLPRSLIRVMDAKGNFEMRGVAPGSYYLWGNTMNDEQRYSARVPIDVGDSNLDGIEVSFHPPVEISGRLVVEENGSLNGATPNVFLQPKSDGPMMGGAGGPIKNDLTFQLTNVTPDPFDINLGGLPEGFYLKSVRMGDQDVTFTGIDFTQGVPGGEMTVVVNPNGAQIEGSVQNAKGENAVGASVTLIPEESHRSVSWLYKTASADQNGHFTMKGIRPGKYKIYAWEEIEMGAYQDPDFVKPHESAGQDITVDDKGHETVQLTAVAAEESGTTKAR